VVLAARGGDSRIYLSLRDLCEALGLTFASQRRRVLADEALHLAQFRIQFGGQLRAVDFLLLEDVPTWLLGVQERRVSAEARGRFAYVKQYLVQAVQRAFAELTGLPQAPSSAIEELGELDRIEEAFAQLEALGRRQDEVEASLDRARGAFRDLRGVIDEIRERMQELEQRVRAPLSPTQRGTVYRMVQQWGSARAERGQTASPGVAIRRCWAELNAAFGVSTYTHLPAARYEEIVRYLKDQYRALTGQELAATEQIGWEDSDG